MIIFQHTEKHHDTNLYCHYTYSNKISEIPLPYVHLANSHLFFSDFIFIFTWWCFAGKNFCNNIFIPNRMQVWCRGVGEKNIFWCNFIAPQFSISLSPSHSQFMFECFYNFLSTVDAAPWRWLCYFSLFGSEKLHECCNKSSRV